MAWTPSVLRLEASDCRIHQLRCSFFWDGRQVGHAELNVYAVPPIDNIGWLMALDEVDQDTYDFGAAFAARKDFDERLRFGPPAEIRWLRISDARGLIPWWVLLNRLIERMLWDGVSTIMFHPRPLDDGTGDARRRSALQRLYRFRLHAADVGLIYDQPWMHITPAFIGGFRQPGQAHVEVLRGHRHVRVLWP